jgi:hypothetical protein
LLQFFVAHLLLTHKRNAKHSISLAQRAVGSQNSSGVP